MVHGANKSTSRKRKDVRITTATVRRFVEKRPGKAQSITGKTLAATARGTPTEIRKQAKTQRRPNRPYGGVMTSDELKTYLKAKARLSLE